MKSIIFIFALFASLSSFAAEECKDSNFKGLEAGEHYSKLQYHNRFELLYEGDSPAPAGFSDTFGVASNLCHDVMATYLKHKASGKTYVMFTTHDDYCDGGNTIGIIVDMKLYSQQKLEEAVVAEIGDSEVYCN